MVYLPTFDSHHHERSRTISGSGAHGVTMTYKQTNLNTRNEDIQTNEPQYNLNTHWYKTS